MWWVPCTCFCVPHSLETRLSRGLTRNQSRAKTKKINEKIRIACFPGEEREVCSSSRHSLHTGTRSCSSSLAAVTAALCLGALHPVTQRLEPRSACLPSAMSPHSPQKPFQPIRRHPWGPGRSPGEGSKQNTIAKLSLWNLSPQEKARPSALCLSRTTTAKTEYWNWILSYPDVQNAAASASHTPTRKAMS